VGRACGSPTPPTRQGDVVGAELPHWPANVELVWRADRLFCERPFIGRDAAITRDGFRPRRNEQHLERLGLQAANAGQVQLCL
jgi:hypothetical protein